VKILLIGKAGSINFWLEDAAAGFRADGHETRLGIVRHAWLGARLESALAEPLAAALADQAARFAPDLMLVIGGFHAPTPHLRRVAALKGRAPLVGWVGDAFDDTARRAAELYDLVAYTDSGLLGRHRALGFPSAAIFLPHGTQKITLPPASPRIGRLAFVANRTPGREAVVEGLDAPISIFGPGWPPAIKGGHAVHPSRVPHRAVAGIYARHLAALNVRNEFNVLAGLNQRSFDPYLSATPVVTDAQADLEHCFEPGVETLVWRNAEDLNEIQARLMHDPAEAARVGEAGRRRVLAEHTFGHRLATLRRSL
jgi:spore maturation protein CgeB